MQSSATPIKSQYAFRYRLMVLCIIQTDVKESRVVLHPEAVLLEVLGRGGSRVSRGIDPGISKTLIDFVLIYFICFNDS